MLKRNLTIVVTVIALLGGCAATADEPAVDLEPPSGLGQSDILEVGECWGLEDEIELDSIDCAGPHIYEVVGVIPDWPYEQYKGSFEKGIAGDDAMRDACEGLAAAYFGFDYSEAGIDIAHGEPGYGLHPEVMVCSAHWISGGEQYANVEGSYADRGLGG